MKMLVTAVLLVAIPLMALYSSTDDDHIAYRDIASNIQRFSFLNVQRANSICVQQFVGMFNVTT